MSNRRQLSASLDPFSESNLRKQRNADSLTAAADEVGGVAADGAAFADVTTRHEPSGRKKQPTARSGGRLRLRGSVQDAFADAKYEATVRGADDDDADDAAAPRKGKTPAAKSKKSLKKDDYGLGDADDAMEDIFGGLDEDSDFSDVGAGDAGDDDDAAPAKKGKAMKRSRIKNDEKAYMSYLEEKQRKKRGAKTQRRPVVASGHDDEGDEGSAAGLTDDESAEPAAQRRRLENDDRDADLKGARNDGEEELLRQVRALRGKQREERGDLSLDAAGPHLTLVDAAAEASASAMEYARSLVDGFNALLSARVQLQPAVGAALRVPQWYALPAYVAHGGDAGVFSDARAAALETLGELLSAASAPPALAQRAMREAAIVRAKGPSTRGATAVLYDAFAAVDAVWQKQIDASVEAVGGRVVRAQAAGKVIDAPLLEQIRAVTSGTERLLHRAQRNRTNARILGHPDHFAATAASQALRVAGGNVDREIFDDVDFVKELVQRSGQWSRALEASSLTTLVDPQKSEAKKGHHRRTKGRTVSYDPRPKLVGFMVPEQFPPAVTVDAIFASLFQG